MKWRWGLVALLRVLSLCWLSALPILSYYHAQTYLNDYTLWQDALVRARMPRACINLADVAYKAGQPDVSLQYLQLGLTLLPSAPLSDIRKRGYYFIIFSEFGNIAHVQGREADAQMWYRRAVYTAPEFAVFHATPTSS